MTLFNLVCTTRRDTTVVTKVPALAIVWSEHTVCGLSARMHQVHTRIGVGLVRTGR